MVCVVGRMRDLILQLSKSSIYSTKPLLLRGSGLSTWPAAIHVILMERGNDLWTGVFERLERDL
ncbi:hypothetical protein DMR31_29575 [Klebsiella variicola]|nr:hypothetical protein DMR31_29575 [Klebsiella variicola]